MTHNGKTLSVIIPCKNEELSIGSLIDQLLELSIINEIIVINDGSTDNTKEIISSYTDITVIHHPYSKGNGASIKAGARTAISDNLLFMDADGQHVPAQITTLVETLDSGYDMVVGSRDNKSQSSTTRLVGNKLYNKLASLITGHKISDLTSGFRACKRTKFLEFISLLPNGFSYPTTITMAFLHTGYSVKYIPVNISQRKGKSHISLIKDGIRFLMIIFKVGSLYSPLKVFAPLAAAIFTSGLSVYAYTFFSYGRFTNMSLLLFVTSIIIFLIGLISEQITMLIYLNINENKNS